MNPSKLTLWSHTEKNNDTEVKIAMDFFATKLERSDNSKDYEITLWYLELSELWQNVWDIIDGVLERNTEYDPDFPNPERDKIKDQIRKIHNFINNH